MTIFTVLSGSKRSVDLKNRWSTRQLDMIRLIELGPFGSRIDRGTINNLDEIPKGYVIKTMDDKDSLSEICIEPCFKHRSNHQRDKKSIIK